MDEKIIKKMPDWPIDPTFLSLRKGIDNKYSASPNNDGFFYSNELRGILADASATLWGDETDIEEGQIFALFQVVPEDMAFDTKDKKGAWFVKLSDVENEMITKILEKRKIIRIHPGNLYPNLDCCEIFRGCEDNGKECKRKCFEMDSRVALLYDRRIEVIRKNTEINWEEFYTKLKEVVNGKEEIKGYNQKLEDDYNQGKYQEDIDNKVGIAPHLLEVIEDKGRRPYVGYRCIYSGLMEYFFPVIYSGRVIAVLMHGQCAPAQLKSEDMFRKDRNNYESLNNSIIKKVKDDEIYRENYNINKKKMLFNHPEGHEPISDTQLNAIAELIKKIEERVENEVKARYKEHVSKIFFDIERDFRKNITSTDIIPYNSGDTFGDLGKMIEYFDNKLKNYRTTLDNTLSDIFKKFFRDDEEGFIRIYAMETSLANKINPNKKVFSTIGDSKRVKSAKKIIFEKKPILDRIKKIESEQKKDFDNKPRMIEGKDLFACIKPIRQEDLVKSGLDIENDVFRMEVSFTSQVAYVIWEKYSRSADIDAQQYDEYDSYLKLIYHTLLEPYFILNGMSLERDLEASMRISAHESAQIIPSIIKAINFAESQELLDGETPRYRGPDQITMPAYKIIDTSLRLLLLEGLFNRSSLIFKEKQQIKPKWFDFYRIIYATDSLFKEKAYWDNAQNIHVFIKPILRNYSLMTDYVFLSHALFNLMDNAIKHSLWASNIYIRAVLNDEYKSNKIIISVVSYGDEIKDRERIFEMGYRSDKAKKTEGMGIGLSLVKKICNILGYEVVCLSSKKIADYHLPIKYHYCKQNPGFNQSKSLKESVLSILKEEIKDDSAINKNIKYDEWLMGRGEEDSAINKNVKYDEWLMGKGEMELKIIQIIYQNEFQIEIPIKGNNLKINYK